MQPRTSTTDQQRRPRPLGRGRAVAVVTAALALAALPATSPGSASELDERQDQVERQIEQTEDHLHHSSTELVEAAHRLTAAEAALDGARAALARTRGELAAAQALDQQLQAELAAAEAELARARAELDKSRAGFRRTEESVRAMVVQQHASAGADLVALATVLDSQDPARLTGQLAARTQVLNKESAALSRLEASSVMLRVQQTALRTALRDVARRRAAAAANLALQARLEQQAERATAQIQGLVEDRARARDAAALAKADDLDRLQQFEAERDQISVLLQRRAERARARAEAAAQARAAAARAAARRAAQQAAAAEKRSDGRRRAPAPRPAVTPPAPPTPRPSRTLAYPVDGYITSSYGMRLHPVYKRWTLHDGTDFGASCGTPIRAATGGTVIGVYYDGAYGNRVIIDHGWVAGAGLGTTYNHLSSFSTHVGERVRRGEVIGYVGTTGYSTGCHLHFMVFRDGATVDPMRWL